MFFRRVGRVRDVEVPVRIARAQVRAGRRLGTDQTPVRTATRLRPKEVARPVRARKDKPRGAVAGPRSRLYHARPSVSEHRYNCRLFFFPTPGNMWGQSWENILDLTIPYPGKNYLDVTPQMQKQVRPVGHTGTYDTPW